MFCARHPVAEAELECRDCGKLHCNSCIKRVKAGAKELLVCSHCEGILRPVARIVLSSSEEFQDLISRPFSQEGITTAIALAVFSWIGGISGLLPGGRFFGPWLSLISYAYLIHYFFLIIGHVGDGKKGLAGVMDSVFDWWDIFHEIGKVALCIAICSIPIFLAILLAGRPLMDFFTDRMTFFLGR